MQTNRDSDERAPVGGQLRLVRITRRDDVTGQCGPMNERFDVTKVFAFKRHVVTDHDSLVAWTYDDNWRRHFSVCKYRQHTRLFRLCMFSE